MRQGGCRTAFGRETVDDREFALHGRPPAGVVIVAVAAVITPSQDPYSLFAMVAPMYLFYEGSILIGRLLKK